MIIQTHVNIVPIDFAQWRYRSLWSLSEARLLLVENYSQCPALLMWNIVDRCNFSRPSEAEKYCNINSTCNTHGVSPAQLHTHTHTHHSSSTTSPSTPSLPLNTHSSKYTQTPSPLTPKSHEISHTPYKNIGQISQSHLTQPRHSKANTQTFALDNHTNPERRPPVETSSYRAITSKPVATNYTLLKQTTAVKLTHYSTSITSFSKLPRTNHS